MPLKSSNLSPAVTATNVASAEVKQLSSLLDRIGNRLKNNSPSIEIPNIGQGSAFTVDDYKSSLGDNLSTVENILAAYNGTPNVS